MTLTICNQNCMHDYSIVISNNYLTIIRILCYALRFIYNALNTNKAHVTSKKLSGVELLLIKMVQQMSIRKK